MRQSLILGILLLAATPAVAQLAQPAQLGPEEMVDRVVAVVGDTVLLYSDVAAELAQYEAAGQVPQDPTEFELFARQVMDSKVSDLMIVTAARNAGLTASEEQVNEQVEQQIRSVQQRFGSEAAFTAALAESGVSRERYRQTLQSQVRDRLLIDQFMSARLRSQAPPMIDESDIRDFFDEQRATLGERPATVSFRQVVVAPRFSAAARDSAIERAREVQRELQAGGDFEVLARRFSDDTGTRERGGDLGWFRDNGQMVQEFARAAFSLRPGQTSGLVETEFGFHIIRVDRATGPERQARHILIRPELTEADVEVARVRADSVAQAIRGGASIATIASRYNTPEDLANVPRLPLDRLPPEYAETLADAPVGALLGPVRLNDPRGARWAVIRVTERGEAGPLVLEDVRDQIRELLQQQVMMEQVLLELRQQMYVQIQM